MNNINNLSSGVNLNSVNTITSPNQLDMLQNQHYPDSNIITNAVQTSSNVQLNVLNILQENIRDLPRMEQLNLLQNWMTQAGSNLSNYLKNGTLKSSAVVAATEMQDKLGDAQSLLNNFQVQTNSLVGTLTKFQANNPSGQLANAGTNQAAVNPTAGNIVLGTTEPVDEARAVLAAFENSMLADLNNTYDFNYGELNAQAEMLVDLQIALAEVTAYLIANPDVNINVFAALDYSMNGDIPALNLYSTAAPTVAAAVQKQVYIDFVENNAIFMATLRRAYLQYVQGLNDIYGTDETVQSPYELSLGDGNFTTPAGNTVSFSGQRRVMQNFMAAYNRHNLAVLGMEYNPAIISNWVIPTPGFGLYTVGGFINNFEVQALGSQLSFSAESISLFLSLMIGINPALRYADISLFAGLYGLEGVLTSEEELKNRSELETQAIDGADLDYTAATVTVNLSTTPDGNNPIKDIEANTDFYIVFKLNTTKNAGIQSYSLSQLPDGVQAVDGNSCQLSKDKPLGYIVLKAGKPGSAIALTITGGPIKPTQNPLLFNVYSS